METIALENLLIAVLNNNASIGVMFDWLLKSLLICTFTFALLRILRNKLASASKHLLLLNIFLCSALLPLISLVATFGESTSAALPGLISIRVTPANSAAAVGPHSALANVANLVTLATVIYLIPVLVLLLKLGLAALGISKTGLRAVPDNTSSTSRMLQQLVNQFQISRPVELRFSDSISSPLSYGLLHPRILLPFQARDWDSDVIRDVLVHELSHVKRLDWLSMLFAYLVASLFWINPLLWIAMKKLNEEAENSSDSTVLQLGQAETLYAENLLNIARSIRPEHAPPLLAQLMLDKSLLPNRIHRILENDMAKATTHRLFFLPLSMLAFLILIGGTNTQVLAQARSAPEAGSRDEVFLPTVAIAPQYPLRAAFGGIEGWALAEFTISEDGSVVEDSIRIADAEPARIFDRASIRAASKFEFELAEGAEPRVIEGVQYLFRFELGEDDRNSIVRDYEPLSGNDPVYPQQALDADLEGNVWLVFTVTQAGSVRDIVVRYSSDDVFISPAIEAANSLRFEPRMENGQARDVARVQYLYQFELDE